jgi:hypothetical protein
VGRRWTFGLQCGCIKVEHHCQCTVTVAGWEGAANTGREYSSQTLYLNPPLGHIHFLFTAKNIQWFKLNNYQYFFECYTPTHTTSFCLIVCISKEVINSFHCLCRISLITVRKYFPNVFSAIASITRPLTCSLVVIISQD